MSPKQITTMRILWGALLVSTLVFLASGYVVIQQRTDPLTPQFIWLPVLAMVSAGVAAVSIVLPRQLMVNAFRAAKYEVAELPAAERMFNDAPKRPRRFADPQAVRGTIAAKVQAPFILGLALAEAVSMNGFVLWFLGFPLTQIIGFFVVCWVLMLTKYPSPSAYERVLENLYDADLT